MSLATNITVNDREPTPVAHTFAPRKRIIPDGYQYNRPAAFPIGDEILTIRPRESNGKFYIRVVLTVPTMVTETINGVSVPKVARVALFDGTYRFDATSTLQERKNVIGMVANLFATSQTHVLDTLENLNGIG